MDTTVKNAATITAMLRHFLTFNIEDPLDNTSRGTDDDFVQYFSGTGAAGQINYLERKPTTAGRFIVSVGGVVKSSTTDYTLSRTAGTITWITNPALGKDNIKTGYQAVKGWVYDDDPNLSSNYFPRISIYPVGADYETFGFGTYVNYNSGPGDMITMPYLIIVRHKKKQGYDKENNYYTLDSKRYKNMEVSDIIAEDIVNYFQTNRYTCPWKFWDWKVVRNVRNPIELEQGIFRKDITVEVKYFDKS